VWHHPEADVDAIVAATTAFVAAPGRRAARA
jgi:hypothetical protein